VWKRPHIPHCVRAVVALGHVPKFGTHDSGGAPASVQQPHRAVLPPSDAPPSTSGLPLGRVELTADALVEQMSNAGLVASLVLVAAALLAAALLVAALTFAARRRWRQSGMTGLVLAVVIPAYGASLVGVSIFTPARELAIAEWKCFDDWCASVTSATGVGMPSRSSSPCRTADDAHRPGHASCLAPTRR
jgi:hypothetical protein